MGIYHPQTAEELIELSVLTGTSSAYPKGFLPPGVGNSSYVPPYQGSVLLIIVIITMLAVYPVVGLRLWARSRSTGLGVDDWLVLSATIGMTVLSIMCIIGVTVIGIGYHSYDLTFHRIDMIYMLVEMYIWLYVLVVSLVRLSILFLIDRIFGQASPRFRNVVHAIMIICCLFFVGSELFMIFQCNSVIAGFRLSPRLTATCSHLATRFPIIASTSIMLDLVVLCLPTGSIWKLNLPLRNRMNVLAVFWVGMFVCATAVVRTIYYHSLFKTQDVAWYGSPILMWSHLESSLAIIISSLPALNKLIVRYLFPCWNSRRRNINEDIELNMHDKESAVSGNLSSQPSQTTRDEIVEESAEVEVEEYDQKVIEKYNSMPLPIPLC